VQYRQRHRAELQQGIVKCADVETLAESLLGARTVCE